MALTRGRNDLNLTAVSKVTHRPTATADRELPLDGNFLLVYDEHECNSRMQACRTSRADVQRT